MDYCQNKSALNNQQLQQNYNLIKKKEKRNRCILDKAICLFMVFSDFVIDDMSFIIMLLPIW
jgi:hypothetical protein